FEVYSFAVRASAFGHNAPLEPVRTDGVITGSKEWDLQLPVPSTTENFELTFGEETAGLFAAAVTVDNNSTGFVNFDHDQALIDFPDATDKVTVTMSRTADGKTIVEFK